MKWKKTSNLIIAIILSIAFIIVTLLNLIGPLHTNASGQINSIGHLFYYSIAYLCAALVFTWVIYFCLRNKPESLFFTLIILGVIVIVIENFIWGWAGS